MKGIVFTEFLDFVEAEHGYPIVDAMIESAAPASGGAYTAVGNYDYREMTALLAALSQISEQPAPELLQSFGRYLFARFAELYPMFFKNCQCPLEFLESIELNIHTEVRKLYPDAELPHLRTLRTADDVLQIKYQSCRPFGHLCLGLIQGCGKHFKADLHIEASPTPDGMDIAVHHVHASRPRGEARL